MIAKEANVGQLVLGHFSTRYDSIQEFKEEVTIEKKLQNTWELNR